MPTPGLNRYPQRLGLVGLNMKLFLFQLPENYQEVPVKLPLLHGRQFELLSVGELKDTLANCLYCGIKMPNIESRLSHINNEHDQEHNG